MIVRRGGSQVIDYGPTPVEGYSKSGVSGSLVVGRSERDILLANARIANAKWRESMRQRSLTSGKPVLVKIEPMAPGTSRYQLHCGARTGIVAGSPGDWRGHWDKPEDVVRATTRKEAVALLVARL